MRDAIDTYYSSPVAADGKVYTASETGKIAVLRAGPDWEVLAVNDLGENIYATPALAEERIYIRTSNALCCFQEHALISAARGGDAARVQAVLDTYTVPPIESRIISRHSKQREDCFQKAVIKRGLRCMRRSALRARSFSSP